MSCDIEATKPRSQLWRLARAADAWAWPDWAYAGPDRTFGHRYDDPRGEYRVLYASSERLGAFIETLAPFRADPALSRALAEIDDEGGSDELGPGEVPSEWLESRVLGSATVDGDFAQVGRSRSLAHLREALAEQALAVGIKELDAAAIRLRVPRAFTQAVSRYVFECQGADGEGQFAGIHYLSRLGDDVENWAIFEPVGDATAAIAASTSERLDAADEDLVRALGHLGLRLA